MGANMGLVLCLLLFWQLFLCMSTCPSTFGSISNRYHTPKKRWATAGIFSGLVFMRHAVKP